MLQQNQFEPGISEYLNSKPEASSFSAAKPNKRLKPTPSLDALLAGDLSTNHEWTIIDTLVAKWQAKVASKSNSKQN